MVSGIVDGDQDVKFQLGRLIKKVLLSSALENEPGLNLKFYTSNLLLINISEGIY